MKPIVLKPRQWRKLRDELHKEYPKSVFLLRDRMKTKLGFTVREHRQWVDNPKPSDYEWDKGYYDEQVHLDFYSENKRTMFLLKWSEFINKEQEWNTLK